MGAEDRQYITRRRVPRRMFERRVGLLVRGDYHISQCFQVGEGGMLLESQVPLEVGQKVVVSFHLENHHMVELARVCYIHPKDDKNPEAKYGVQFLRIEFTAKRHIRNYVAAKQAGEQNPMI